MIQASELEPKLAPAPIKVLPEREDVDGSLHQVHDRKTSGKVVSTTSRKPGFVSTVAIKQIQFHPTVAKLNQLGKLQEIGQVFVTTLENAPVRENAEGPLVQVHDGVVDTLVAVDDGVRVEPHDQVVAQFSALLQEVLYWQK